MEAVEAHLLASLRGLESPAGVPHDPAPDAPLPSASSLTGAQALSLFDAQLASRHLDVAAHWLRSKDAGYYTIGSSGHEGNAAVAAALRPTDPALLHYRSGAFYVSRGWQVPGHDPVRDVLLGLCAAAEDPISGGRHKVFGHPRPGGAAADVDDRVSPASRRRDGVRGRTLAEARSRLTVAGRRRGRWPAPVTRRSTTRPSSGRSTPPAGSSSPGSRCRCSSWSRTTGWGSASRALRAGSRPR